MILCALTLWLDLLESALVNYNKLMNELIEVYADFFEQPRHKKKKNKVHQSFVCWPTRPQGHKDIVPKTKYVIAAT